MLQHLKDNVHIVNSPVPFNDRAEAGRFLSAAVRKFLDTQSELRENTTILGVPRSGMLVAVPVAQHLQLPLDIVVTHKLRSPHQSKLIIGAVTERGRVFLNKPVIEALSLTQDLIHEKIAAEKQLIAAAVSAYRQVIPACSLAGKTVIVVDDNVVTGATMFATLRALWAERPRNVVLAVPIAPRETLMALSDFADHVIALNAPDHSFKSMKDYYRIDQQPTEGEIIELLRRYMMAIA